VTPLPITTLLELERTAVQLAQLAGEYIHTLPLDARDVQFKTARSGAASNSDPVSNIDREIEARLRRAMSQRFPHHLVIGEESAQHESADAAFIWVVDPLDGTTNYLNGLPLFGSSIAVLHRHVPVAGAIWCACTHERRPGVYHAYHDGPLSLDGAPLIRKPAAAWRGLASEPGDVARYGSFFETRVLAAAALECAFAAAGVLRVAHLQRPAIWDVAAGVVLARAGGCCVLTHTDGAWREFTAFAAANARVNTLRAWRQPVLICDPQTMARDVEVVTARD
jgi:myo-inositol-1(or 4)-monophosphatase